jgi:peptidoglycan/LPS O-acetylase OafA/YrhL
MGQVRFALALIVLVSHAGYTMNTIGSLCSVQAFYVLSGIYMAAVWNTKYSKIQNGTKYFLFNRFLRLWPTYITLLILTFLVYEGFGRPTGNDDYLFTLFREIERVGFTLKNSGMILLSILLLGQDIVSVNEQLHYLLPVRQSWSIASEVLFYLTVPFFISKSLYKFYFIGFVILMTGKYIVLKHFGLRWSYFFPFWNFGYFLLGCGLYYISLLSPVESFILRFKQFRIYVIIAVLLVLFRFGDSSFERGGIAHHFTFITIFSIAAVFLFDKSVKRIDLFLGNISYGVYLNHFLVIVVATLLGLQGHALLIFTLSTSILLSYLTEKLIQKNIDRRRNEFTQLQALKRFKLAELLTGK